MLNIAEELKKMPDKPGIYIMKDKAGKVIYVGKAVLLKNRVKTYFQSTTSHSPKTQALVSQIASLEFIVTHTELEALILECNLIKKHKPKYNILLKDDKNYPYIKITTKEEFPRIIFTRKLDRDGSKYFGPYSGAAAVREMLDMIKKLFPVRLCTRKISSIAKKQRPCLNYQLKLCSSPCSGEIEKDDYLKLIRDAASFLSGNREHLIKEYKGKMDLAAVSLEFEKAAVYRDRYNALLSLSEKQKVLSADFKDRDVLAAFCGAADCMVSVFNIREGKLLGKENHVLEGAGEETPGEIISSFVKQYYSERRQIPPEILVPELTDDKMLLEEWLSSLRKKKVKLLLPNRGEKRELIRMASENAKLEFTRYTENKTTETEWINSALIKLSSFADLDYVADRIEAYDISNTGNTEISGSMVVFNGGRPDKKEYRRFKIKSVMTQDDFKSMEEMLIRRFKFGDGLQTDNIPDIILVDGGIVHVNTVKRITGEKCPKIPVLGMVKDERHRTRALVKTVSVCEDESGNGVRSGDITADGNAVEFYYANGRSEYDLSKDTNLLRLISFIQDEAHRFAIDYNRKLVRKRNTVSELDSIEGIGPKRRKALLKAFGSIKAIEEADIDKLSSVNGMNKKSAEKVYEHFRKIVPVSETGQDQISPEQNG